MADAVSTSPWLPLRQAAIYAGRSRRFLAREIRSGRLKAARIGGRGEYMLRAEWIDQWIESQAQPVAVVVRRRA